jgi:hypothetical protein
LDTVNAPPVTAPKRLTRLDTETTRELWHRADKANEQARAMMLTGRPSAAMSVVEVPVRSVDINTPMHAMAEWLDKMRIEPSNFSWTESRDRAVLRVQFKIAEDAVAFAEHFLGSVA